MHRCRGDTPFTPFSVHRRVCSLSCTQLMVVINCRNFDPDKHFNIEPHHGGDAGHAENAHDVHHDGEDQEKPHAHPAASEISNTYSSLVKQNITSQQRARKSKPYQVRYYPSGSLTDVISLEEHCSYINPKDGK